MEMRKISVIEKEMRYANLCKPCKDLQGKMWKRPFWDWCADHFLETFVVPGNHEFYGGFDIGRTMADYEMEVRPNVRYLNNRSVALRFEMSSTAIPAALAAR